MIKKNGGTKKGTIQDHIPQTIKEMKEHIEKQFDNNMTWENHGNRKEKLWQLDHIFPDSLFKYDSLEHKGIKKSWSNRNLRPLIKEENQIKLDRIIYDLLVKHDLLDYLYDYLEEQKEKGIDLSNISILSVK